MEGIRIVIDGKEHPPAMLYQFGLDERTSQGTVHFDLDHFAVRFDSCDEHTLNALRKYDTTVLPGGEKSLAVWSNDSVTVKRHLTMPPYINVLQFMIMFYIEAASYIDVDDPKWMIYTVHHALSDRLLGFCSVYRFFKFPQGVRARISQFFVFPEHQRKGHGQSLYRALMSDLATDGHVKEVTVESPAESFSRLKIKCDAALTQGSHLVSPRDKAVACEYRAARNGALLDRDKRAIKIRLAREHQEQLPLDKDQREQAVEELLCEEIAFYRSI